MLLHRKYLFLIDIKCIFTVKPHVKINVIFPILIIDNSNTIALI